MAIDWTVTFDASNPKRLADFWALALGYVDEEGYDYEDGASLVDPQGRGPAISFLRVPEGKTVKNRCHLDVRPTTGMADPAHRDEVIRAKVADLTAAGATVIRQAPIGDHIEWVVMADPEGNEFCVA
jgi:hypothetical protein